MSVNDSTHYMGRLPKPAHLEWLSRESSTATRHEFRYPSVSHDSISTGNKPSRLRYEKLKVNRYLEKRYSYTLSSSEEHSV